MSHFRESLNDLLGPNLIASCNSWKREGGNNQITSQLVFHVVNYPPSLAKRGNAVSYIRILVKSTYL